MDINKIRSSFPILNREVHGHPLIYLDNAATSQKPQAVIDSIVDYYTHHNANIHRGVHTLSDESSDLYEASRNTVANFIHSKTPEQLIFVRNTTEAMNLIAFSWGENHVNADDEIIVTELEHHSSLLPWQRLAQRKQAHLIVHPVEGNGELAESHLISLIKENTKIIVLTHISNVLGAELDIQNLAKKIKKTGYNPVIVLDAAQSVPHIPLSVEDLSVDFMAFSGHKMLGPQGIGGLWVKKERLNELEPFLVGGGMISQVYEDHATWADFPDKFDAGTPNVAGAIGLAAACNYLDDIGLDLIHQHEKYLMLHAITKFEPLIQEKLIDMYSATDVEKVSSIITFNIRDVHPHDAAQILDREHGIAVRSGHHCNQLLTKKLGVPATLRASVYLYNTTQEIDKLIEGIYTVKKIIQ